MDIRKKRKELGLTQRELARLCNVSIATVQNWEFNLSNPNEKNQQKLADILDKQTKEA